MDNSKSKSLRDSSKNHTMPFYSYFSEKNHILEDLISQVLQCSLWVKPASMFRIKVRQEEKSGQRSICGQRRWKFYHHHLPMLLLVHIQKSTTPIFCLFSFVGSFVWFGFFCLRGVFGGFCLFVFAFFTSTHGQKFLKNTFLPFPKSLEYFVNALGLLTNVD